MLTVIVLMLKSGSQSASQSDPVAPEQPQQTPAEFRYSCYTLSILMLVYIVNFIDRQILAILNEEIKGDLGLTDAQMGFLYGTAFAVFYALFCIVACL